MSRSSSTTCKTSSRTFLTATSSVTTMGFMFYTSAPRTARALAPKPWVGPSPCSLFHRKRPPVCGGKRPLCTLGVPPGRSRGIGGCARAPCVFLAAAEGTARGSGRVRGSQFHLPIPLVYSPWGQGSNCRAADGRERGVLRREDATQVISRRKSRSDSQQPSSGRWASRA